MAWINTISWDNSHSLLRKLYQRVKGSKDQIDNILKVHSLRPHTLKGHLILYKSVLHHSKNQLPKWYLESIGIFVSMLNACQYCIDHHTAGLIKLIGDKNQVDSILAALQDNLSEGFSPKFQKGLIYARKLTEKPDQMTQEDILPLKEAGFSDGEILEINQVTAYFNYANRTVLGLGVQIDGETLGLSPSGSGDEDLYHH